MDQFDQLSRLGAWRCAHIQDLKFNVLLKLQRLLLRKATEHKVIIKERKNMNTQKWRHVLSQQHDLCSMIPLWHPSRK